MILEASILNNNIVEAISRQLEEKINSHSKEFNWKDKFSFIKNIDYSLDKYKKLISVIETKIFSPFENEEKLDILGRAYKIFLKRAGKVDNKNIILTPDHIKSLMVNLAELNCNDVVLDTCTGTGGFLMQSMEVMIKQCKQNESKIKNIKENQLIGFEIDSVLFALACSNMFLHGDGRTNLIYRSSLIGDRTENTVTDDDIFSYIKNLKPTKVIINPPYEDNKSIKFVKQAIDYLEPNGKLVIIMPTPTLRFNIQNGLTASVLEKATLDFVIRMPERLFSEQGRTVNTSIFGFTKTPHIKNKKVLFYDLSDDGFVSIQHKGRLDVNGTWPSREKDVLQCILNNEEGIKLSEKRLIYSSSGVLNPSGIRTSVDYEKLTSIGEIFDISKGTLASDKAIEGDYSFITAGEEWKTHETFSHDCEALVYAVAASGSLGRTHYVNGKFIASNLCLVLTPKKEWRDKINMPFMATYLNSMKDEIKYDLADGTSKLTINPNALADYRIKIPELCNQQEFYKQHIKPFNDLKKSVIDAQKNMEEAISKIN